MYLQYPEEKKKARDLMYFAPNLLENETIPRLPPSTTKYLSPNIIAALEGESKQSQSPSRSPKKGISTPPGTTTPIGLLASAIGNIDRNSQIYKDFRSIYRSKAGQTTGLPTKNSMLEFATDNNIIIDQTKPVKEIAEQILQQMPKKKQDEQDGNGLGLGLLKKRKKYRC